MATPVKGEEFAQQFSRFVNIIGNDVEIKDAIKLMCQDHRTLQQSMVRFCVLFIQEMAKKKEAGLFDGRNEHAVNLCHKIVEQCGEDMYLPLI